MLTNILLLMYSALLTTATQHDSIIPKAENKTRSISLALETFLEFNKKDKAADMNFLNSVQKLISKVKTAISKHQSLRRDLGGEHIAKFTDFIQNVLETLIKLNDSNLEHFFRVLRSELRKYHYKGCKFNELTDNDSFQKFVASKLKKFENMTVIILRNNLIVLYNKMKEKKYDAHERYFVKIINSLYGHASIEHFKQFLMGLDDYRIAAKENMDIKHLLRDGIRSIIFDHYTQLSHNVRVALKSDMGEFLNYYKTAHVQKSKPQIQPISRNNNKINEKTIDFKPYDSQVEGYSTEDKKSFTYITLHPKIKTDNRATSLEYRYSIDDGKPFTYITLHPRIEYIKLNLKNQHSHAQKINKKPQMRHKKRNKKIPGQKNKHEDHALKHTNQSSEQLTTPNISKNEENGLITLVNDTVRANWKLKKVFEKIFKLNTQHTNKNNTISQVNTGNTQNLLDRIKKLEKELNVVKIKINKDNIIVKKLNKNILKQEKRRKHKTQQNRTKYGATHIRKDMNNQFYSHGRRSNLAQKDDFDTIIRQHMNNNNNYEDNIFSRGYETNSRPTMYDSNEGHMKTTHQKQHDTDKNKDDIFVKGQAKNSKSMYLLNESQQKLYDIEKKIYKANNFGKDKTEHVNDTIAEIEKTTTEYARIKNANILNLYDFEGNTYKNIDQSKLKKDYNDLNTNNYQEIEHNSKPVPSKDTIVKKGTFNTYTELKSHDKSTPENEEESHELGIEKYDILFDETFKKKTLAGTRTFTTVRSQVHDKRNDLIAPSEEVKDESQINYNELHHPNIFTQRTDNLQNKNIKSIPNKETVDIKFKGTNDLFEGSSIEEDLEALINKTLKSYANLHKSSSHTEGQN